MINLQFIIISFISCCIPTDLAIGSCGGRLLAERYYARSIRSPLTSGGTYQHNLDCKWYIYAPAGSGIDLQINYFDTEDCCDKLYVYGGTSTSGPLLSSVISGKYTHPLFIKTTDKVVLRFRTDHSTARRGFQIYYYSFNVASCIGHTRVENRQCFRTSTNHTCSCSPGYETVPNNSTFVSCLFPGEWQYSYPTVTCTRLSCSSRSELLPEYATTSTCIPGYGLVKPYTTNHCQSDSSWPKIPTCRKVNCGNPPSVQNTNSSSTRSNGTRYKDIVTYTCLPGYGITRGSGTITCQSNRRWSAPPTCSKVNCGNPPQVQNIFYRYTRSNGTRYRDTTTYTCRRGYERTRGTGTITCQSNGTWSTPPTCSKISCGNPPSVQNTISESTRSNGTRFRDTATYTCLPGYEITRGTGTIICGSDRRWFVMPICSKISCGNPPTIQNTNTSSTRSNGTRYRDTTAYTCLPGYEMTRGNGTIQCQSNRRWSTVPICRRVSCGNPPLVQNTNRRSTRSNGTRYRDTATYTCLPGYERTRGSGTITCQSSRRWSTLPICNKVNCGRPPSVQNTNSGLTRSDGTRYRDTITYTCLPGYERIRGSGTIRCQFNRRWSTPPSCGKISCGNVPLVQNTNTRSNISNGTRYRDTATYTCLPGYEMTRGNGTITCQSNRRWSTMPICGRMSCGNAPSATNARLRTSTGTRYLDTTTYTCLTGYERTGGSGTIRCQSNRRWSTVPTCSKVNCGRPPSIQNTNSGLTRSNGTRYRDTATYTCLPGYEMTRGNGTITCRSNRRWSTLPICSKKNCGPPPTIINGRLRRVLYNTTYDSEVTYTCDNLGYTMRGSDTVRCAEDGTWSTPPICHRVNCGSPPSVTNSKATVAGHSYNDTVTYECEAGYEMSGNESIHCQIFGHWTVPPTCRGQPCSVVPAVPNARNISVRHNRNNTVGDSVNILCIPGYEIVGDSTVECLPTLQWSTLPSCNRVNCGPPPTVVHSQITVIGHLYNDSVTYECDQGYELTGDSTIFCLSYGHWSIPPACRALLCPDPPTVINSLTISVGYNRTVGDSVEYFCLPGYETVDDSTVECLPSLQWSTLPSCDKVNCGLPPEVVHSQVTVMGHLYNDSVTYECDDGYELTRDSTVFCLSSGHWSIPPTCQSLPCPDPPLVTNSLNVSAGYNRTVGDSVEYICLPGYVIVGDSAVECLPTLLWSTLPNCNKLSCGPPPIVQHSHSTATGYLFDDSTRYHCETGYDIIGNDTIFCTETGDWSHPPNCRGKSCPEPSAVEFSRDLPSGFNRTVGDSEKYVCLPGYEMVGNSTVKCLPSLQWSTLPTCNKVRCGSPYQITNSSREVSGHYLDDITVYTCHHGYQLSGNSTIYCKEDGHWSTPPECHSSEVRCGTPYTVANSNREVSGHYLDDITVYTCHRGYQLSGNSTIYCKEDGHWSAPPECHILSCGLPPQVPQARTKSISGFELGETIYFECVAGEFNSSIDYIICESSGNWSQPPYCKVDEDVNTTVSRLNKSSTILKSGGSSQSEVSSKPATLAAGLCAGIAAIAVIVIGVACRRKKRRALASDNLTADNAIYSEPMEVYSFKAQPDVAD